MRIHPVPYGSAARDSPERPPRSLPSRGLGVMLRAAVRRRPRLRALILTLRSAFTPAPAAPACLSFSRCGAREIGPGHEHEPLRLEEVAERCALHQVQVLLP